MLQVGRRIQNCDLQAFDPSLTLKGILKNDEFRGRETRMVFTNGSY